MTEKVDTAGERDDEQAVLLEVIGGLEDWSARLPTTSPWKDALSRIRAEVASCLEPSFPHPEQPDSQPAERPRAA